MSQMITRDRGPFRILLEPGEPQGRSQYFEVEVAEGWRLRTEILFVRDARVAFNVAVRRFGRDLLAIRNLETGRLVVGGR